MVNTLIESGLLKEQECGNNISFILDDLTCFSNTDYKILQSNDSGVFVKCMKMLFNGKIQFLYLTDGLRPFSSMISILSPDSFVSIASNIFRSVCEVKSNGFLKCKNLNANLNQIYIDSTTNKAYLLYFPLNRGLYQNDEVFESELRSSFAKIILGMSSLAAPRTMQLFSNLQNGTISIDGVFDNLMQDPVVEPTKPENIKIGELQLISINSPTKIIIKVTKEEFVIGRSNKHADGVIPDNKMVGRSHCRVSKLEGKYVIQDLDSANGTYLNKVKLVPGKTEILKNGDVLRLANLEMKVKID